MRLAGQDPVFPRRPRGVGGLGTAGGAAAAAAGAGAGYSGGAAAPRRWLYRRRNRCPRRCRRARRCRWASRRVRRCWTARTAVALRGLALSRGPAGLLVGGFGEAAAAPGDADALRPGGGAGGAAGRGADGRMACRRPRCGWWRRRPVLAASCSWSTRAERGSAPRVILSGRFAR